MMKNFIWRRVPLKKCDPGQLVKCIEKCWDTLPERKRKKVKRRLFKIAKYVAKDKYAQIWPEGM